MYIVINKIRVTIQNYNTNYADKIKQLLNQIEEENHIIVKIKQYKQMDPKPNILEYIQNFVKEKTGTDTKTFTKTFTKSMTSLITDLDNKTVSNSSKPIVCCAGFTDVWGIESRSTSYLIRLICNSFMNTTNIHIIIDLKHFKKDVLLWDNINKFITITIDDINVKHGRVKRRAIAGLGPSGCGKTTFAKKVLANLNLENVCAIDGGNSRDESIAWQLITTSVNMIKDLYKTFTTGYPVSKDLVLEFIRKFDISVYIPDTAASDFNTFNTRILDRMNINELDPNWIFLCVWQHLNTSNFYKCNFPKPYKCIGCDVSGKNREKTEGKKYNSTGYPLSLNAANKYLKTHTGLKIIVHNSGSASNKSVIWSNDRGFLQKFDAKEFLRIHSDCTYIHKTLTDNKILLSSLKILEDTDTDDPPTFVIVSHNTRIQCLLETYNGKPESKKRFKNGCIIKIEINTHITWTVEYAGEISENSNRSEDTYLYYNIGQICQTPNKYGLKSCCIYLVRHGEGSHNLPHIIKNIYDAPLTDNGISQATNTGIMLNHILEKEPDMWFVSKLQRTHQTLNHMLTNTMYGEVDFNVLPCSHEVSSCNGDIIVAPENQSLCKNKCGNIGLHSINWKYYNNISIRFCSNKNMLQVATEMYEAMIAPKTPTGGRTRRLKPKRKTRKRLS
jgi:broad specificity phosphatase PhoE